MELFLLKVFNWFLIHEIPDNLIAQSLRSKTLSSFLTMYSYHHIYIENIPGRIHWYSGTHKCVCCSVSDVNVLLDEVTMSITEQFHNMLTDCDLVQHVVGSTHTAGHTLDVFISCQSYTVGVDVDFPVISDHSLITGQLMLKTPWTASNTVTRRNWKAFSIDAFKDDLSRSEILTAPASNDCDIMLDLYSHTMEVLLDKHAISQCSIVLDHRGSMENVTVSRSPLDVSRKNTVELSQPTPVIAGVVNLISNTVLFRRHWSSTTPAWSRKVPTRRRYGGICNPCWNRTGRARALIPLQVLPTSSMER